MHIISSDFSLGSEMPGSAWWNALLFGATVLNACLNLDHRPRRAILPASVQNEP